MKGKIAGGMKEMIFQGTKELQKKRSESVSQEISNCDVIAKTVWINELS